MLSFYPGPSKVYPQVPAFVQDAYDAGLLSANHRSPEFVEVSSAAVRLLREKLHIPAEYSIFFTSSATECWEIISQSLVSKNSLHVYNGAFGEKWYRYALKLQPKAIAQTFDLDQSLNPDALDIPSDIELIAMTHNETSNGTAVNQQTLGEIKGKFPAQLLAVDATSSMAGVALNFSLADVWYASVQKCFGLPAGLAVMICSPRAMQKAAQIGERDHYNSLLYLQEMMEKFQTTYTPNVLNIYLLMRVMEQRPDIFDTQRVLEERHRNWTATLTQVPEVDLLVKNEAVRSLTVIPFIAEKSVIDRIRSLAREQGMVLGNGYGKWKENSLRIANFPALEDAEINRLHDFFFSRANASNF